MAEISVRVLGTELVALSWSTEPAVVLELDDDGVFRSGSGGQFELVGDASDAPDEDAFGFTHG